MNRTLAHNENRVRRIAAGELRGNQYLYLRLGQVTGYEAYFDARTNNVRTRDTFGVAMVLRYDPLSPEGFVVRTAYPANINPFLPQSSSELDFRN